MYKKNLYFILIAIICIVSIGIFNYIMDPYVFFHKNQEEVHYDNNRNLIYTYFKVYGDYKYKNVVMGPSEAYRALGYPYLYLQKTNNLVIRFALLRERYELLKHYLELHPETEHVYFVISIYKDILSDAPNVFPIPEYTPQKPFTLQELYTLLLSKKTLTDSFSLLQKKINNKNQAVSDYFYCRPYISHFQQLSDSESRRIEEETKSYIKKTIDLLKEKNLKYSFIIFPINSSYLVPIYQHPQMYERVENIKRYIVQEAGELYDFSFINQYTTASMFEDNYLFEDDMHVQAPYGVKIYKYFFDKENAENGLCFVLNKDNVESTLQKERSLLENFVKENPELVKKYDEHKNSKSQKRIRFKLDNMPDDLKKEMDYMQMHKISE